ncbi:IS110 family transposase [Paraeggerthella hongkongensis]|uniref:IS110 family transposase n=1 Tax=Paraeggerthella hongkongensis TaxID=230658 RepID=A0A3N0AS53_9ACTN|nr:IS110 family transposase [Paraeggerthella hongkongensis]RNL37687.1 IS110 family transposase [Paraeggerthella hongkongensis]
MAEKNATLAEGHEAYLGLDVGKQSHWAYAVDAAGAVLLSRRVANAEADVDAVIAECPDDTLVVVDQRRNIGALAIRRARAAGRPVAYLPGSAEHALAKGFPGIAKTDERDAQVIARAALGLPQALRPVPADDPALEGARIMSAQLAQVKKDRTACANALRSRLLESCPAFERACDATAPWCAGMLSELGGPWNMLDAGRERFCASSRRHGAAREQRDRLWDAISGERPSEQAVAAEMRYVRHFAGRIAADNEEEAALGEAIAESLSGNADFANLQTVPGIGPRTAAQLVVSVDISEFDSHDKLASYCGLAPSTRQSGTSIGHDRAHRGGNKALKSLLVFSCNSLVRSKGYYGEYLRARLDRGVGYRRALRAVARKRMKVIYAVMRDGVPYSA